MADGCISGVFGSGLSFDDLHCRLAAYTGMTTSHQWRLMIPPRQLSTWHGNTGHGMTDLAYLSKAGVSGDFDL